MAGKFSTGERDWASLRSSKLHQHSRLRPGSRVQPGGTEPLEGPLIQVLNPEVVVGRPLIGGMDILESEAANRGVSMEQGDSTLLPRERVDECEMLNGSPTKISDQGLDPSMKLQASPMVATKDVETAKEGGSKSEGHSKHVSLVTFKNQRLGGRKVNEIWNLHEKPWHILLPQGTFRSAWDFYIGFLLLYVGAFLPYRLSYLGELNGLMKGVEVFVDLSFGIDILLNFFTAYELLDGRVEYDMKKIATRYVRGFFFLDVLATFPFELVIASMQASSGLNHASKLTKIPKLMKIVKMTRFLKLLRVYRLSQFIREVEINYNIHDGVSRLINIVAVILFVTHLVGCLWHAIGIQLDTGDSCVAGDDVNGSLGEGWVCREGLGERGDWDKYIASIYWAFSTLTTVGYGDINARTIGEQAFSMIMMLLGVSWYAYVVGSMSAIVASFDRQNKQKRLKMLQVNTFIRETKIPNALAHRVRKYYEYSLSKRKNGLFGYDADEILAELSTSLRTDIVLWVEEELIAKIPFFSGKSPTFVANAIQASQPVVVQAGDYIIKEGSAADEMYFLVKGIAAVYYGEKKITSLEEGKYFGEIGCILGGIRRASIKAETLCELLCLSKRNLNILLGQHPEVGYDLKQVARSRMKVVKKETGPKTKERSSSKGKTSMRTKQNANLIILQPEQNLQELEQVEFGKMEDESEAFADLRAAVGGMARRLSLTSGKMSGGSHIKPDVKAFEQMNNASPKNSGTQITPCNVPSPVETATTPTASISKGHESLDQILASLHPSDYEVINAFILQTVADLVERKLTQLTDIMIANNARIMDKVRGKLKEQLRATSTS